MTGLQMLNLADTHITDAGLKGLNRLTALRILYLEFTARVTPAGVEELRKALPNSQITR
jgi:hypothetical protein